MGTNYYWHTPSNNCPSCGHDTGSQKIHIGKSSAGWVFSLHVYPEGDVFIENTNLKILDLRDWLEIFNRWEGEIRDEYDNVVNKIDMIQRIVCREPYVRQRHLTEGSGYYYDVQIGLYRSCLDAPHARSNGSGTWDCHTGDFS